MHAAFTLSVVLATSGSLTAQFFVTERSVARHMTRVVWLGLSGEQRVAIEYGQPKWSPEYEKFMLQRSARNVNLGKDARTTLQTSVDLTAGEQKVAHGRWYLGLRRDEDQKWTLELTAADKADAAGLRDGTTGVVRPDLRVPMRLERNPEAVDLLEIKLGVPDHRKPNLSLSISWGNHRLCTDLAANFDVRMPKGTPEFALSAPEKVITTGSGLQYEQLRAGEGAFPGPNDMVRVHYTGWLTDGTMFDSSYLHGEPQTFPVGAVVKGFGEGLRLMQPGATFRLTIPSALAYGERGAGESIGPNTTLVFTVTLLGIEK